MPRPKIKQSRPATFNLSVEIAEKLDKYCNETGIPKTTAVERFIDKCIKEHEEGKSKV